MRDILNIFAKIVYILDKFLIIFFYFFENYLESIYITKCLIITIMKVILKNFEL